MDRNYRYLNKGAEPLFGSRLLQLLEGAQKRAPVSQWMAFIKGAITKGIKTSEIEESKIIDHLSALPPDEVLERDDLVDWLQSSLPTVKEIDLSGNKVEYRKYSHAGSGDVQYFESLYVLNTKLDNIDDRIEEIRFELEELDFDAQRLSMDPMLAVRLHEEQQQLLKDRIKANKSYSSHWHSTKDPSTGKSIKNLLAHARVSLHGNVYFIEEIQSDWAQGGRKHATSLRMKALSRMLDTSNGIHKYLIDYLRTNKGEIRDDFWNCRNIFHLDDMELEGLKNWACNKEAVAKYMSVANAPLEWRDPYLAGPWVTNTELWAGLILRRQLQRAAENPEIERVAWIHGRLRNGNTQAIRNDGIGDGLDNFYLKILPKIANKILAGTGVKSGFMPMKLDGQTVQVPGILMTDPVREKMRETQPLYSRDVLPTMRYGLTDNEHAAFNRILRRAHDMLGNDVSIRLSKQVLDAATGKPVAARTVERLIEVSFSANNPARALAHESWHYAYLHLLAEADKQAVDRAFANGTTLNSRVRERMVASGSNPDAIAQCDDAQEAAAHGWSLWLEGKLPLSAGEATQLEPTGHTGLDRTVGKVFRKVEQAFLGLGTWMRRTFFETKQQKAVSRTHAVFEALRDGLLREGWKPDTRPDSHSADTDDWSEEHGIPAYCNRTRRMLACD